MPILIVQSPDGRRHERRVNDRSVIVSDWLEAEHLPLNTRCGGRGLCRGCLVGIDGAMRRACQTVCLNLSEIVIPESSLRDHRINGVSAFEIGSQTCRLRPRPGIGLAIDVGTTTVAAALWDLKDGRCLASGAAANEQRRFGDNVLSRIDHAVARGGRSRDLQRALVADSILPLLDHLCQEARIAPAAIDEAVAAGNTVMLHSLSGADLSGFAAYPFRPEFLDTQCMSSRSLGFPTDFPLILAANLGPFVGADITVGALASGMLEVAAPALLIDFGTNGEILLKTESGYLGTATAAGPAFEGGRLNCGAAAGAGVISSLAREGADWSVRFCKGPRPSRSTGIAGAAYIDFLHYARQSGMLNRMGRLSAGHEAVTPHRVADETELRVRIHQQQFVSESDVAELIQAKAAILGGVLTLLEEAGLEAADLATLYIAGGFGYHLNVAHAMNIGLLPSVPPERIQVIGNASLGGASLLLQAGDNQTLGRLREKCRVVELNQLDNFEDIFIDAMPLEAL